ncbi:sugar kinase [Mycolicibacterium rhodesiae]|uniref:Sugar kinase n=1 Tax=Mycolicibacterium rhodesiae TaxID=36814 RepID=A0A1X0IT24_MYCRH|nr:ROK family transcriptional regulator [Mycolicibacterium rhodesiae]ORB51339.1 sugar kinase [Mycolicibacterium rhodesiae]
MPRGVCRRGKPERVASVTRAGRIGSNTDDVRRRNLSVVLTLVHRHGALSRAELTRRTGLSRSTVKDLVEQLAELALVAEIQAAVPQVGRPSPIVSPQPKTLCVAINPETDAVTVGLVALGGTVLQTRRYPTDGAPTPGAAVAIAKSAVDELRSQLEPGCDIAAIGAAVPGLVHGGSAVRLAPHLEWHDADFGHMLHVATDLPVFAANDANAGAIAEHIFGRHHNADHMIYVNGGPGGIGAGFVVAGELLEGLAGYAGELGHTYVGGDAQCHCGNIGCLETQVSQGGGAIDRQARYLAIALSNAVNMLNPGLIVLGGFLRAFPELAGELLAAEMARHSLRAAHNLVRVVPASLGAETLMIGAAELAFAPLLADPAAVASA